MLSLHFLESESLKLKAFCLWVGAHAMHDTKSACPKKLFHVSICCTVPGGGFPALNVTVARELLQIIGKVCGCFVLVKITAAHEFAHSCFALAGIAKPVLQDRQACPIKCQKHKMKDKLYVRTQRNAKCPCTFPKVATRQIYVRYVHQHEMTTPIPCM